MEPPPPPAIEDAEAPGRKRALEGLKVRDGKRDHTGNDPYTHRRHVDEWLHPGDYVSQRMFECSSLAL